MSKQSPKDILTRLDEQIEFFTAQRHFSYVGFFEECKNEIEQLRQLLEETKQELPAYLFDGYAVYQALPEKAKARTSTDNVSDVLDALVKLARQQPQGGEDE